MGQKTLIYSAKLKANLNESLKHLQRLKIAFCELEKEFTFPINKNAYQQILLSNQYLAYTDQLIYRFSKLQDCMGAKLFKAILLYEGENTDKSFLDILNALEKMNIINVEEWFELRDLRNEIAHDYEDSDNFVIDVLNKIYLLQTDLEKILVSIDARHSI